MFLTKEQILAAQDRRYAEVDVPEWGGKIRLQSLDADQTLKHERMLKKSDEKNNPLTSMLAASIVDQDGKLLFDEKDLIALGKKSPKVLVRLIDEMKKLNKDEKDEKGEEEDEEGKSEANPADD